MHESNNSLIEIPLESLTPGDTVSLESILCTGELHRRPADNTKSRPGNIHLTVSVLKGLMVFTLALLAAIVFGCGTMHARSESKIIPITTFNQIEGKWEGLSKRMPDMRDHAQVLMVINERGHFNFISDEGSGSGVFLGTGALTILNGQVSGTSGRGTGTITLHNNAGTSVLVLEAALTDGHHYYVEMTRMK